MHLYKTNSYLRIDLLLTSFKWSECTILDCQQFQEISPLEFRCRKMDFLKAESAFNDINSKNKISEPEFKLIKYISSKEIFLLTTSMIFPNSVQ